MFGTLSKVKVFKFETHHHYNNTNEPEVKAHSKKEKKSMNDKNIGEYVDYEEIK